MTIKTKLTCNAVVVLAAISVIILSALISARTVDRNVRELTQKTAPYQLKALNQQRALQAHASNLVNLSASKSLDEYKKTASSVSETLSTVNKTSEDMARLKGEGSGVDKTISEITQGVVTITERRLKAEEEVLAASNTIQGQLSEATKRLDAFVHSLQQKNSGTMVTGVDKLMTVNQQLNNLNVVRDGLKEINFNLNRIPEAIYKWDVIALQKNLINKIKNTTQVLKQIKGQDKIVNDLNKKLTALNEKLTATSGIVFLQLRYIADEDDSMEDKIRSMVKGSVYELTYLIPILEKTIEATAVTAKSNTEGMAKNLDSFSNINNILSLASGLSLLSASLDTKINNFIYSKNMEAFDRHSSEIDGLFKEAGGRGQKLQALLAKSKNVEEGKLVNAFLSSLSAVKKAFSGAGGVAEKVKASIKNNEELEALNGKMRQITASQLKESQKEVSQAGVNQENVVTSLNRASKRTMQIVTVIGGVIIIVSLFMAVLITRSITRPINQVVSGLSESAGQVASASNQVASASQSLAEGSSEQAAGLEETSSSLEEMSAMTKQNADNAEQARLMIGEAGQIVGNVSHHMEQMAEAIVEITKTSEDTGKIIKTIDEIAFQTNLLALNAAVEAARAGEAGAGFAVVADEVRNLALRAAEAAKNTSSLIENTIKSVKSGNELTQITQEAFKKNVEIAEKVSKLINEIAAASQEQAEGIAQVSKAVMEMDRVTQGNAASAEESASAAEEMNAQSETMEGFVAQLIELVGGKRMTQAEYVNREPVLEAEAEYDEADGKTALISES